MWLRVLRKQANLTQEKLAMLLATEGLSYTAGAIGHWETGRYLPPLNDSHFRSALARSLGVSETELLSAAGYEIYSSPSTPEAQRAAMLIDKMDTDMRRLAVNFLERLLNNNN